MASGTDSPSGLDATSSLEMALDQAIARRFAGASERSGKKRRNTPVQNFAVVAPEPPHTPTDKLPGARTSTALAVAPRETALMRPPARLQWKGIEVTDEFQEYAARVARGEDLEPYRGPVLSRPCDEFPWNVAPERHPLLPPAQASQRSTLAPVSVPFLELPVSERPVYPERGRTLKTALWVAGAVSSIVGALGVGAGATNTASGEFAERAPDATKLAQQPERAAGDETLISSADDATRHDDSIGERQLTSLAADTGKTNAPVAASPQAALARSSSPRPASSPVRAQSASIIRATAAAAPASPANAAANTLRSTSVPSAPAPGVGELSRGIVTMARPAGSEDAAPSSHGSSLFSDRAPF